MVAIHLFHSRSDPGQRPFTTFSKSTNSTYSAAVMCIYCIHYIHRLTEFMCVTDKPLQPGHDRVPGVSWEPYFCVLLQDEQTLTAYRSEELSVRTKDIF